jgi:hypothetical protein
VFTRWLRVADAELIFSLDAHERGGVLFQLERESMYTQNLQLDVRDLNILPDRETLVLRLRLPALPGNRLQEELCLYSARPFERLGCAEYVQPIPPPSEPPRYPTD